MLECFSEVKEEDSPRVIFSKVVDGVKLQMDYIQMSFDVARIMKGDVYVESFKGQSNN